MSISYIESQIQKKMIANGFRCGKDEGVLFIKIEGQRFNLHLWETSNEKVKRLYFVYNFAPENIHWSGLCAITNAINYNFPHITMISCDNFLSCRFETSVENVTNFMEEKDLAYRKIGEAVRYFYEKYSDVQERFSKEDKKAHKVGFTAVRNDTSTKEPATAI